jgi:membrane protein YdbS with pleckstrin-like domain
MKRLDVPGADWQRVSSKLIVVDLVAGALFFVITGGGAYVFFSLLHVLWLSVVLAALSLGGLVNLCLIPRRVRSIGYQLREDDLLFRRGIMWQRFVAVPYGRMQLVDINRGPVARSLGLSELKFVTAAAAAGVTIPGLLEADADALRDRLVSLAESRRAGL